MEFKHKLLTPYKNIVSKDTAEGRFYFVDDKFKYSSVTTVIGKMLPADYLDDWKARVGETEATKILKQAGRRGTAVHKLLESYVLNEEIDESKIMPTNLMAFKNIKNLLDIHVKTIYGVEIPVYSPFLKSAGRTDLIADWDGEDAVVDFKNTKSMKSKDDIYSYFIQLTAYSFMINFLYKIFIRKIVIVMHIDHESPKVFVEDVENYIDDTVRIFREFQRQTSNK